MSYNGSGTFVINSSGQPVSANTLIEAAVFNAFTADMATGLSTAICKDGQTTVTANIPMSGFKFTGLGAGSAAGNSLRYEQLFTTSAVTLLGAMDWVKGANIASAATINLTTATGNAVHVTGTTQIDAVTLGSGMWRLVIFDGALTLTHHATNNNLPGGANITTAANDRALYWADGTTVYCAAYTKASGKAVIAPAVGEVTGYGTGVATALAINVGSAGAPVVNGGALGTPASGNLANCTGYPAASTITLATPQATTSGTSIDFGSIPAGTKRITAVLNGVSTNGTSNLLIRLGTAGGIQTSTYVGAAYGGQNAGAQSLNAWADGVELQQGAIVTAADVLVGTVTFTLMNSSSNIWGVTGAMYRTGGTASYNTLNGTITLSGAVTTLRLTTANGTDTFDAGSMNIAYEI